jgi:hypothetical protein
VAEQFRGNPKDSIKNLFGFVSMNFMSTKYGSPSLKPLGFWKNLGMCKGWLFVAQNVHIKLDVIQCIGTVEGCFFEAPKFAELFLAVYRDMLRRVLIVGSNAEHRS